MKSTTCSIHIEPRLTPLPIVVFSALILLFSASCRSITVHQNGYFQTIRYKTKSIAKNSIQHKENHPLIYSKCTETGDSNQMELHSRLTFKEVEDITSLRMALMGSPSLIVSTQLHPSNHCHQIQPDSSIIEHRLSTASPKDGPLEDDMLQKKRTRIWFLLFITSLFMIFASGLIPVTEYVFVYALVLVLSVMLFWISAVVLSLREKHYPESFTKFQKRTFITIQLVLLIGMLLGVILLFTELLSQ